MNATGAILFSALYLLGCGGKTETPAATPAAWSSGAGLPSCESLNSVAYVSGQTFYASGSTGLFLKSTDAGATWSTVASRGSNAARTKIVFTDASTGWMGDVGGDLFKTTDGGSSWSALTLPYTTGLNRLDANAIHAASATEWPSPPMAARTGRRS